MALGEETTPSPTLPPWMGGRDRLAGLARGVGKVRDFIASLVVDGVQ